MPTETVGFFLVGAAGGGGGGGGKTRSMPTNGGMEDVPLDLPSNHVYMVSRGRRDVGTYFLLFNFPNAFSPKID